MEDEYAGVHTCHKNCTKWYCLLRKKNTQLKAALGWKEMGRKIPKNYEIIKHSQAFMEELCGMQKEQMDLLSEKLGIAITALESSGNANGIAATFLEFHGRETKELKNCVKMMKKHEELAQEALAKIEGMK